AEHRRNRRHGPRGLRRDAFDRPRAEVPVEEGPLLPARGAAPRPVHPPLLDGHVPHDSLRRGAAAGGGPRGDTGRADEPGGERRRRRPGVRRPADRREAERRVKTRDRRPEAPGRSTKPHRARPSLIEATSRFLRHLEKTNDILLLTTSTRYRGEA